MRIESAQHQHLAFSAGDRIPPIAPKANSLQDRVTLSEKQDTDVKATIASELSEKEKRVVNQLRIQDREVRAHEQAHKAAAGSYAQGAPTFKYETGPDGKRYAVGGEVQIDLSPVPGDPRKTITKAQTVQRAANAPSNPSAQDRQVASQAAQMAAEARRELIAMQAEERDEVNKASSQGTTDPGKGGASSEASEGFHVSDTSREGARSSEQGQSKPNNQFTREAAETFRVHSNPPSTGSLLDIAL